MRIFLLIIIGSLCVHCTTAESTPSKTIVHNQVSSVLDYTITPEHAFDKTGLMYSDQGAWFAYGMPENSNSFNGFSGPFLMTQENGVWSASSLCVLKLMEGNQSVHWDTIERQAFNSHLIQRFSNDRLELVQTLIFQSGHTARIRSRITNKSDEPITLKFHWENNPIWATDFSLEKHDNEIHIASKKSDAIGILTFPQQTRLNLIGNSYTTEAQHINLMSNVPQELEIANSFIFPEYNWTEEKTQLSNSFDDILGQRITEKEKQLDALYENIRPEFDTPDYRTLLVKAVLTLQNNWRIPAGELKHEGLFPSYHYKWFNGFWSWDSWKHAVGLSYYDTRLAKEQVKAMFDFQNEDGFVADCVYRDTSIEPHNYRDTKPPLSAWAVDAIYKKDGDLEFVTELYPKLKKYHYWWYTDRDHDQDGICEYGSTDGSLIAAKWESGMDNAIRFDNAEIVTNAEGAFSIDQESVDLNAYLYAEKVYLAGLAELLGFSADVTRLKKEAAELLVKLDRFYDPEDGWYYDLTIDGDQFIKGEGSEGWTALWTQAASTEQSKKVISKMLDSTKFYTRVPFQTMSADHPKFDPLKGYWRGPNWLDQSYFGIKSLRNYGYHVAANQATHRLLEGAEGILEKGMPIRENYHPITGEGLNAKNFSWSAAHIIMMLMNE